MAKEGLNQVGSRNHLEQQQQQKVLIENFLLYTLYFDRGWESLKAIESGNDAVTTAGLKVTISGLLHWLHQNLWLCGSQQTGKFWKRWKYQTTWPAFWEICMQIREQQLELDMEQQTASK